MENKFKNTLDEYKKIIINILKYIYRKIIITRRMKIILR